MNSCMLFRISLIYGCEFLNKQQQKTRFMERDLDAETEIQDSRFSWTGNVSSHKLMHDAWDDKMWQNMVPANKAGK